MEIEKIENIMEPAGKEILKFSISVMYLLLKF